MNRFKLLVTTLMLCLIGAFSVSSPVKAQRQLIRFGVGPLQPTPAGTKAAFEPFFAWLAEQLDVDYELTATDSWAGVSVALISEQVDVAWMGPWGYVLANDTSEVLTGKAINAIATVKYDDKPIYYAIIVGKPGLDLEPLKMSDNPSDETVKNWIDKATKHSISFADLGSTSGFLIPTAFFKTYGVDAKNMFSSYTEGATHAANETAVVNDQVDLATDFNRNRNTMIDNGVFTADQSVIYWESNPLPNDAIAVRAGLDPVFVDKLHGILLGLTPEVATELKIGIAGTSGTKVHYTGFIDATDASYSGIRKAGIFIDKIGSRARDMEMTAEATPAS